MALLSPKQVAEKYGFSASQIRRMVREGLIKSSKIGRCYVIDERSIKNLKRRRSKLDDKKKGISHEDVGNGS